MHFWNFLLDLLLLLAAAMVLGALCEWLKQSAIVGYLLSGTLLGPYALRWIGDEKAVSEMAELGVALLLFSIGLEFSWRRMRGLGATALLGGTLQLVLTASLAAAVAVIWKLPVNAAIAVGAMVGLSSTACVLRTLTDRTELDSVHGRSALGILLLQDVAVVPLVVVVTVLTGKGSADDVITSLGTGIVIAAIFVAVSLACVKFALPRVLSVPALSRNRELPILFAMVTAVGSAWVAWRLGLSPALGAFIAGVVLGESPVATQVRADVGPLKTLFVTLFFASVGMLADPRWIYDRVLIVVAVVAVLIVGKALVVWLVGYLLKMAHRHAVATGICLAQVGEFSFVLASAAHGPEGGGLVDTDVFKLIVSVTIATLFFTPYLISVAPGIGAAVERALRRIGLNRPRSEPSVDGAGEQFQDHVIIVGFGPAGRAVAEALEPQRPVVVIDLNPQSVQEAKASGMRAYLGDATTPEILELARVTHAQEVVLTVPDHRAAIEAIRQIRALNATVPILARARYHIYVEELESVGAHVVVDEEASVGERLAVEVRNRL